MYVLHIPKNHIFNGFKSDQGTTLDACNGGLSDPVFWRAEGIKVQPLFDRGSSQG